MAAENWGDVPELPICGGWRGYTTDELNARTRPSAQAEIVGRWYRSELLVIWARCGEWLLCQAESQRDGLTGWSHQDWIVPA